MTQKYIKDDLVMTRTEPNNFTPNGVVCKFVDYERRDKVLLRTINGIDGFIVKKISLFLFHSLQRFWRRMGGNTIMMVFIRLQMYF